jgi:hypothetical protein
MRRGPAFEDHQRKERVGVILAPGDMRVDERLHLGRREEAAARHPLGRQQLAHQRLQFDAQPVLERDAEPLLLPVQDAVGQQAAMARFSTTSAGRRES